MALEMNYEDLCRDLKGCVVMFKNKPVYVTTIGRDGTVYFLDLLTQREGKEPFTLKAFDSPVRRVGFVNVLGSCVYVSRLPVRKYFMGLCLQNTSIKTIVQAMYEAGAAATKERVKTMMSPELGDAIMNKYPSFEEAVQAVHLRKGAVAFDTQFCVTTGGAVVYKGQTVGSYKKTAKKTSDIAWEEGKEHLAILLDNNHEKTVRDYRPQASN